MTQSVMFIKKLVLAGFAGGTAAVVYSKMKRKNSENSGSSMEPTRFAHPPELKNFRPSVLWESNWDGKDPRALIKQLSGETDEDYKKRLRQSRSQASRYLIFIRHGQYHMGQDDPQKRKLTELGREQAHMTGRRLKDLGLPYNKVVYSTKVRASETSDIIRQYMPEVPAEPCDLIREGLPVPPQPPHRDQEAMIKQAQVEGPAIEAGFKKYFSRADKSQEKDSYDVIVCHGNVIRYYVCRALQLPPEAWLRMSLSHGSITVFRIGPTGNVSIRHLGDTGHMPPEKLSR